MQHSLFKILLFSFLLVSFVVEAQVLQDYQNSWEKGEGETWIKPNDRLILDVDLNTFPLANIYFDFPEKSVVFIGEKLWIYTKADTSFSRPISDLTKEFGVDNFHLTVFKKGIQLEDAHVRKVLRPETTSGLDVQSKDLAGENRRFNRQEIRDFFYVAVLTILLILAIYKVAYPYLFSSIIRPDSLITAEDFSDSGSLQKFFSSDVLFYLLMVNLLTSLVGVIGLIFYRQEWLITWFGMDFNSLMIIWSLGALGFFLFTILKFIGIRIIAYLFDLGKLEFAHFFYLLRLVVIGIAAFVLVIAFFLVNEFSAAKEAIGLSLSVFFWLYIAGIAGLFLIMMNRLSFKKYHLFTYLCIAELVPFLIMAKWVMMLGQ